MKESEHIEEPARAIPCRRFASRREAETHLAELSETEYLAAEPYTVVLPRRLDEEHRARILERVRRRSAQKLAPLAVIEKDGEFLVPVPAVRLPDGRLEAKRDAEAIEIKLRTQKAADAEKR